MATLKQKKVFDKVVNNGESVSGAMRAVGYAKYSANKPDKLTRSKGWQELMDKHLPDSLLARKHKEGLDATTKKPHLIDRDDKGRPVYEYVPEEDFAVRHRYLDSAYKLKGRYVEEAKAGDMRILVVLPTQVIQKNGIYTSAGDDSGRPAPIQSS